MKMRYRHAVISWCSDLRDPDAEAIPVAVLLVGSMGGRNFAASMGVRMEGLQLDRLSADVLSDVTAVIRSHLNEVFQRSPAAPTPDSLLYSLHDSLRNSLHVSSISGEAEKEVGENEDANSALMAVLTKAFQDAVVLGAPEPRPVLTATRPVKTSPFSGLRPHQVWGLEKLRVEQGKHLTR